MTEEIKLTEDQRNKLNRAIDLAEGLGACRYVSLQNDKPMCVIGQLAVLEGVSPKQLINWTGTIDRFLFFVNEKYWPDGLSNLKYYPINLLKSLQQVWDAPPQAMGTNAAKAYMKQLVANHP